MKFCKFMVLYYQPERNLSTIFSYLFDFFHVFATFFTVLSCKLRYKSNKYLLFDFCIHISFLCIFCVFTANICRNCIYFANATESTERYTCACDDIVVLYACTIVVLYACTQKGLFYADKNIKKELCEKTRLLPKNLPSFQSLIGANER